MRKRYVGIPYVDQGRGFEGCDCYGLLRLVLQHELSLELPSYAERYSLPADRKALAALIAGELEPWDEIAPGQEQPFDAVLMREAGVPRHVGVVVAPGLLLHVERGGSSAIERYRSGPLRFRVLGFYRYRRQ